MARTGTSNAQLAKAIGPTMANALNVLGASLAYPQRTGHMLDATLRAMQAQNDAAKPLATAMHKAAQAKRQAMRDLNEAVTSGDAELIAMCQDDYATATSAYTKARDAYMAATW